MASAVSIALCARCSRATFRFNSWWQYFSSYDSATSSTKSSVSKSGSSPLGVTWYALASFTRAFFSVLNTLSVLVLANLVSSYLSCASISSACAAIISDMLPPNTKSSLFGSAAHPFFELLCTSNVMFLARLLASSSPVKRRRSSFFSSSVAVSAHSSASVRSISRSCSSSSTCATFSCSRFVSSPSCSGSSNTAAPYDSSSSIPTVAFVPL